MPYIDGDKLIQELSTMYKEPTSTEDFMTIGYDKAIADVVVTAHRQPTADVVKVVRCKDCKYFVGEGMYCENDIITQFDHFFCYYGERRDDAEIH